MPKKIKFPYSYNSYRLQRVNGHATFTGKPSKKLLDAVNKMAELAAKNLTKKNKS